MKEKILVVDDDDTLIAIVDSILQKNGFDTALAKSAKDAFSLIDKEIPDLILLDIRMLEMDGYEALLQLKSDDRTKDIPVIMLTSENDIGSVSKCLEAGAHDYIVKPFDHQNLIIRIRKTIN